MNQPLTEISYADLAREAKSRGDMAGVWRAFKNHARVKRKQWAKKKAAAVTATIKEESFETIPWE